MKKVISVLFGATLLFSMLGVVSANADPGPNGHNNHGLCTAYFNGQKVGHDKNGTPGPFQALEDAATGQDGSDSSSMDTVAAVFDYCSGLIGGNPTHGRYDCSTDQNGDTTCTQNPKPGNGPA